ncbi:TetR/AcrR family transcriptional regulator [Mycolicibacterium sp. XJ1819]
MALRKDQITAAATALVHAHGLSALTMSRVASELGVGEMTLYWHFPTKQSLLESVADGLLKDLSTPAQRQSAGDRARRIAETFWEFVTANADLGAFLCSRGPVFPTEHGFRLADAAMQAFLDEGLSADDAARRFAAIWVFTAGHVTLLGGSLGRGVKPLHLDTWRQLVRDNAPDPVKYPALATVLPPLLRLDAREYFDAGFTRLMEVEDRSHRRSRR